MAAGEDIRISAQTKQSTAARAHAAVARAGENVEQAMTQQRDRRRASARNFTRAAQSVGNTAFATGQLVFAAAAAFSASTSMAGCGLGEICLESEAEAPL